ncbi:MAG: AAA family ATPase [Deltaproteobacteria bacterium]|nr:AAA family ATPase [Candidatus Zymogenaceae bacterium]
MDPTHRHIHMLLSGLSDPGAYPHSPPGVESVQTPISLVFLAGDLAYKVKKPVSRGFLDFSTLSKRKFYCEEEVRLNRRLCPDIYRGVVAVTKRGEDIKINGGGEIIDYAVEMKRLPAGGMMNVMLDADLVTPDHIRRIAGILDPFYRTALTGKSVDEYGSIDSIRENTDENFTQTEAFIGKTVTREQFEDIREYTDAFFNENRDAFERRVDGGFIREGHGDLHSRNICIDGESIHIYDCIEFNERFRMKDVAEDMAFLAMDLDFHLHPSLSSLFVSEYRNRSGDDELPRLLPFYTCYTAYVRGKVESFIWADTDEPTEERERAKQDAAAYFSLAHHYAVWPRMPFVIVMTGLSGTGKSALARAVAEELGWDVISTDEVRKEIAGIDPSSHQYSDFNQGIYTPRMHEETYREMLVRTEERLLKKQSVILDGAYLKQDERERVRCMTEDLGARFLIVHAVCTDDLVEKRIEGRMWSKNASDATVEVFRRQKTFVQAPNEGERPHTVRIDTSESLRDGVKRIIARVLLGDGRAGI